MGSRFVALLSLILFFASCASRYNNALFTSKTDSVKKDTKAVFVINDSGNSNGMYKIKANDLIAVRNLQDIKAITPSEGAGSQAGSSSSISYRVENDGSVALPVIGKVEVAGLTRREAAEKIQNIYKQSLLKDPIIDLSVINLKVTMLGEFTTQGNFLLEKDNTSLIDIIGQAGGITAKADAGKLKIIRGEKENPEIIYVNLKDINSLSSKKLILQNNDLIYLEPQSVYAKSERVQLFSSFVQPAIILLNTALLIFNLSK